MATWKVPTAAQPPIEFFSGGAGVEVSLRADGFGALATNLLAMPRVARDAAGYEMADIAREVIADAKENYVPWQSGHLHDSGDSDRYVPGSTQNITEIAMWFGGVPTTPAQSKVLAQLASEGFGVGNAADYALKQHEEDYKHPVVGPVTHPQMKYLEKPFDAVYDSILPRIAKAVEEVWQGGGERVMSVADDIKPSSGIGGIVGSEG